MISQSAPHLASGKLGFWKIETELSIIKHNENNNAEAINTCLIDISSVKVSLFQSGLLYLYISTHLNPI